MNCQVILTNLREHAILFNESAEISNLPGGTEITMRNDDLECIWKVLPRGVIIENREEAVSILSLFNSGKGRVRIVSEFGELAADLSDVRIERSEHVIQVSYSIAQQERFSFSLQCDDFCF